MGKGASSPVAGTRLCFSVSRSSGPGPCGLTTVVGKVSLRDCPRVSRPARPAGWEVLSHAGEALLRPRPRAVGDTRVRSAPRGAKAPGAGGSPLLSTWSEMCPVDQCAGCPIAGICHTRGGHQRVARAPPGPVLSPALLCGKPHSCSPLTGRVSISGTTTLLAGAWLPGVSKTPRGLQQGVTPGGEITFFRI